MHFTSSKIGLATRQVIVVLATLCLMAAAQAAAPGLKYTGRVVYRGSKAAAPGVLVEVVEAKDDGRPTDEVLGSARAEADGRFTVTLVNPTNEKLALVVSAVRTSADSGGDRRGEGYEIKSHRTVLGFLPFPSATKPNTIFIERRKVGDPSGGGE